MMCVDTSSPSTPTQSDASSIMKNVGFEGPPTKKGWKKWQPKLYVAAIFKYPSLSKSPYHKMDKAKKLEDKIQKAEIELGAQRSKLKLLRQSPPNSKKLEQAEKKMQKAQSKLYKLELSLNQQLASDRDLKDSGNWCSICM
jgi:hypothetical protein